MSRAPYSPSAYRTQGSWRSRTTALALSLLLGALLVLVLIRMGALPGRVPFNSDALATFRVLPPAREESSGVRHPTPEKRVARRAEPKRAAPPPPALPPPPIVLPGVINLSRSDFAAADVGRFPSKPADAGEAKGVASADSGSVYGPGDGPGGQRLFYAEWYREPTHAELVTYLPQRQQAGWGMIACRTIDRYHVDDCRELGETPGSGIARALRQAAWQFLVRPPRIDGKPQIGAWVRIKFDLVEGVVK